jgi:hypothetical protein
MHGFAADECVVSACVLVTLIYATTNTPPPPPAAAATYEVLYATSLICVSLLLYCRRVDSFDCLKLVNPTFVMMRGVHGYVHFT